jgi:hypothetical protein
MDKAVTNMPRSSKGATTLRGSKRTTTLQISAESNRRDDMTTGLALVRLNEDLSKDSLEQLPGNPRFCNLLAEYNM